MPFPMRSFILLAIITRLNIVLNIFGHSWTVEVAVYHLEGVSHTHMSSKGGIMLIHKEHLH